MSSPHATLNGTTCTPASDNEVDLFGVDARLHEEMQRLAAINQELLGQTTPESPVAYNLEEPGELAQLRKENADLRAHIAELEQALGSSTDSTWADQQKEYEALLEEKSEVIRSLHLKIQELGERPAPAAEEETGEIDVNKMKKEMAELRRQLEEDEESLMQQMRQMEMAMSKDRAELARQRNEIQRLHNEVNHEIEIASRDPGLRERLVALQRLQGEITGRKTPATPSAPASKDATEPASVPARSKKAESSGLFRRIFGK
jgi:chromosome segregation ATPase